MGWKEKGKYGVSTGRTVRSPFARVNNQYGWYSRVDSETLLKFTRGTETLSSYEMEEFLMENNIDDGLGDFDEYSTRLVRSKDVHRSSVVYSLKKRKRWTLPERTADFEGNVTFLHRRLESRLDADCFAVHKTKSDNVVRSKNRKYGRVQDLLKSSDSSEPEPEICYEMSYRYPSGSYPAFNESDSSCRLSLPWPARKPHKARCKDKGVRNKGHRWGMYSDAEVGGGGIMREEPVLRKFPSPKKIVQSKIAVVDASHFNKCKNTKTRPSRASFNLGSYVEELLQNERSLPGNRKQTNCVDDIEKQIPMSDHCSSNKYGKNSVIYIDPEPTVTKDCSSSLESPVVSVAVPSTLQPEEKVVVTLDLSVKDVEPRNLEESWKDLYSEAASLPRKFTIDLEPSLHSDRNNTYELHYACVLFEVVSKARNGVDQVKADVSVHAAQTGDSNNAISQAVKLIHLELSKAKQDIWRVAEVIDIAVHFLRDCWQPCNHGNEQSSKSNYPNSKQSWNSLEMLSSMFGWKSKVFSPVDVKSELRKKIKQHDKRCSHGFHSCSDSDRLEMIGSLEDFCGICYQEVIVKGTFTALKSCHHVSCNACWVAHLKTQISIGNTSIQCPEFNCNACVDHITLMFLVPSLYGNFMSRKIDKSLETTPDLKWCPYDRCGQVVKATVSCAATRINNEPIPVACSCGGTWCFQCRKEAHWPASCVGNEKFHKVTKQMFAQIAALDKEELITSVMVRNCPQCDYPIEKHHGCNFMYCIMCQTSFCWDCLTLMSKHSEGCRKHERSKQIELDLVGTGTNRFAKNFASFLRNKNYRSSMALSWQRSRLRQVNETFATYKQIGSSCLYVDERLEDLLQSRCFEILKSAARFKYEAHLTLEGAAKMAIMSKSVHRFLCQCSERLQFILERIGELMQSDIAQLIRCKSLNKLCYLLDCGKNCVLAIGQFLASGHPKLTSH